MANITITRETENFMCKSSKGRLQVAANNANSESESFEINISNLDELINLLIDTKTDIQTISFEGKVK